MKKLLVGLLLSGAFSIYAAPVIGKTCSGADVSKENLGVVIALLNKNGLNYTVVKKRDSYRVVAKAANGLRYINKKLSALNGSEIMSDLGINFRRTSEGECFDQAKIEDLSEL